MKSLDKEMAMMLGEAAKNIAQMAASSVFEFWQRKDFRLYVEFDHLPQTEQDRIFNELEVSLLGLFHLQFDHAILEGGEANHLVLRSLQRELSPAFLSVLSNVGVEKKYLKQWQQLIDMRLKEYRQHVKWALDEAKKEKELKNDPQMQVSWAQIETITVDCLSHIRQGDVKEGDPLWKLLRKWLITQYAALNPIMQLVEEDEKRVN